MLMLDYYKSTNQIAVPNEVRVDDLAVGFISTVTTYGNLAHYPQITEDITYQDVKPYTETFRIYGLIDEIDGEEIAYHVFEQESQLDGNWLC